MMLFLSILWIFLISLFAIELIFYAYSSIRYPNKRSVRKRLKNMSTGVYVVQTPDILRKRVLSDVVFLNKLLLQFPGIQNLEKLIKQANSSYSVGFYLLLCTVLTLTGFLAVSVTTPNFIFSTACALVLGACPLAQLRFKKRKRIEKFEKQLPDALDLIARALKAGHAFTSGLKLAADEFDDPLGPEFGETIDEINFGVSVSDALKNLTDRIDCPDLRFFAVSVILQRETGGNLAEIIEGLAQLVRERFKFQGKVKVLSAEGKFSAIILLLLPFFVGLAIRVINPDYSQVLFSEPAGRLAMGAAVVSMTMGVIFIRKMIKINV